MGKREHPSNYMGITEEGQLVEAVVIAHIEEGGVSVRYLFDVGEYEEHNHKLSDYERWAIEHYYDRNLQAKVCVRKPLGSRVTTAPFVS